MSKTKQRQRQQKPQGQCIFCQGHGLTKQHIWPNWISSSEIATSSHAANSNTKSQMLSHYNYEINKANKLIISLGPSHKKIDSQGSVLSIKSRTVCRKCNNEWMSRIEDDSKNTVLSLQGHNTLILNTSQQLVICKWITLLTIMAEFTDIPSKQIPSFERLSFYQNRVPLPNWQIWIGKYQGVEWDIRYHHFGAGAKIEGRNRDTDKGETLFKAGIQGSIFAVGGLVIFVLSTCGAVLEVLPSIYEVSKFQRIWPLSAQGIEWNKAVINSDADLNELRYNLDKDIQQIIAMMGKALI